ncbi:MAG: glycine cleavage system protein GcvH [Synergistaceae bacterium]|jgi:glycine cleavage system H protein|nr:glycine cleavage system protein GcvH [Synergistaceae bacterium]
MKTFGELDIRKDLSYTKTHEWAKKTDRVVRVGVDDYAQSALGDIVYVELPSVGAATGAGAAFGSLESTKAVSDLNSPVTGKVVAVNEALSDSPELINASPYEDGWIVEIEVPDSKEFDALLKSDAYSEFVKTLDEEHQ